MAITRDEVARLARLSGLDLGEKELDQLAPQLAEIITALARVQEVPADGIPATSTVLGLKDEFRGGVAEELGEIREGHRLSRRLPGSGSRSRES